MCNSLGWVDWKSNPVQVELCDACGTIGCVSGGYVHVSNVADLVFWTAPRADLSSLADVEYFPSAAIERFGSIAFTGNAWHQLRAAAREIPEQHELPQANGRVIRDAWVMGRNRPRSTGKLQLWLSAQLVAADPLDTGDALRWIEYWLLWFRDMETTAIEATVSSPARVGATIEKLYFDGPAEYDWPALARYLDYFVPVLEPDLIFIPAQISSLRLGTLSATSGLSFSNR